MCACDARVEASLEHWYVTGLQQQGIIPSLIASTGNANSSLLSVLFELNPEDTAVDQLLHVHSQPVEIIYDAVSNRHTILFLHQMFTVLVEHSLLLFLLPSNPYCARG